MPNAVNWNAPTGFSEITTVKKFTSSSDALTLATGDFIADMTTVGLAADLVEPLMRLIESSSDRLNALRAVVLNQILDGPQP